MRKFILGTDWWTDCDDAVAMRLVARAVKGGEIALLGIGINAAMPYSVPSLDGFLSKEGLSSVPLGIDLAADDFGGEPPYQKRLSAYAVHYKSNAEAEEAVSFYRRLLAEADAPVEVIEIGYLQVISALLQSGADEYSDKSGIELVKEKVSHFWVMAGKWDKDGERENNFCRNPRSRRAARIFCEKCPVPVTFLGWEVGHSVISGGKLLDGDHLRDALCDHGSYDGRSSWDPMLVYLALTGDPRKAGYSLVRGYASVEETDGKNRFIPDENGPHAYVVKEKEDAYYRDLIDEAIATIL